MNARVARLLRSGRQLVLTAGAVLGVGCLLLAALALLLDARPLVFRSDSMAPTIRTGSLAIAHRVDARSLEVGQVVSVPTSSGERVTHRIQSVQPDGPRAVLVLKGDANKAPDASPYVVDHADEVLFSVPWVGYAVGWINQPVGLFVLGLYAAFLLSVVVRPGRTAMPPGTRGKHGRHGGVPVSLLVLVVGAGLVSGGVLQARTTATLAAWTDAGTVSGTRLTAYVVAAPGTGTCVPAGNSTTREMHFTWPASAAPPLGYAPTVAGLTNPVTTFPVVGSTQHFVVAWPANQNPNTVVTATATGYPSGAPAWLGPTSTWKFRTAATRAGIPTCGETDPPTVTFTEPVDGATRTRLAEIAALAAACGNNTAACGTRIDASGISTTRYHFERRIGSTVTCWNTSWTAGNCTTQWRNATVGGNVWRVAGNTATAYQSAGTYTLDLQVTDTWNNVTTATVTFTLT